MVVGAALFAGTRALLLREPPSDEEVLRELAGEMIAAWREEDFERSFDLASSRMARGRRTGDVELERRWLHEAAGGFREGRAGPV